MCAASVHLGWDGNWSSHNIWAVSLMLLTQSSDNSFSWPVVTTEVAPHQKSICPHRMKVVTWLYCLLLSSKSVTHVKIRYEEVDMMPLYSYLGISTTVWTGIMNYIVQEVAVLLNYASYQWWLAHCPLQWWATKEIVKDVRKNANKPSGKNIPYCLIVNIKQAWY